MKSSKELETKIQQLELELVPLTAQLDDKIKAFASDLSSVVEAWMAAETKRRVEANAERVNAAGIESLRKLKADLSKLVARLPELCGKAIGSEEDWPHRQPVATHKAGHLNSGESYFSGVFRTAINHLGAVLNNHGLLEEPAGYARSWERSSGNQFRYAFNPGLDENRLAPVVDYQKIRANHKLQSEELEKMRQELVQARARELWESA
ncbi:MAG TPA: hypothetical protein VLB76_04985 [Thermoanaerobaculia bacterium]|nr:hypothetical protein [Thermoanaerobaculia bacterium]